MKIFSVKNENLSFFNRPIYVESVEEALSYIQNILSSDADRALLHLKNELSLVYLGDIDFTTGKITPCEDLTLCWSLADIFDSVPSDRIPQNALELQKEINSLREQISNISEVMKEVKHDNACRECRNYRKKTV